MVSRSPLQCFPTLQCRSLLRCSSSPSWDATDVLLFPVEANHLSAAGKIISKVADLIILHLEFRTFSDVFYVSAKLCRCEQLFV